MCCKLRVWSKPPARAVPWAFTLFFAFLSHGSRERNTGYRLGSGSGQLSRSPYLHLISESLGPGVRSGAEAAWNETPEAGLAWPGSGSGQLSRSPYLNLTSDLL